MIIKKLSPIFEITFLISFSLAFFKYLNNQSHYKHVFISRQEARGSQPKVGSIHFTLFFFLMFFLNHYLGRYEICYV